MTVSVSQLNKYVSFLLSQDSKIKNIIVTGEISNFIRNSSSGHCYFTLKDSKSSVRAVMFNSHAYNLDFRPENGMSVDVTCSASIYERDGLFQLYVTDMKKQGEGDLLAQFEKLKQKLAALGMFDDDKKKIIPQYPQKIGVIASKTGAALQDVINILSRRYPLGEMIIFPSSVQGETADISICNAIKCAESEKCDVLIIARGGGSFEDLNCFNSERLALAVYECSIPVISAVGHETDFTICDFVADLRAPTPSAAAELCAIDKNTINDNIFMLDASLNAVMNRKISEYRMCIDSLDARLAKTSVTAKIENRLQRCEMLKIRLDEAMSKIVVSAENALFNSLNSLEKLNPLNVLKRGYAMVCDENGRIISDADDLVKGEKIDITLAKGKVKAIVDLSE